MESQNKLFEAFKEAAAADEQTTFLAQDKLWGRIEQQLDKQETKKIQLFSFTTLKYAAAALVLITGIAVGWNYSLTDRHTENNVVKAKPVQAPESSTTELVAGQNKQPEAAPVVQQTTRVAQPVPFVVAVARGNVLVETRTDAAIAVNKEEARFTLNQFNEGPEAFKDQLTLNTAPASFITSVTSEGTEGPVYINGTHSEAREERLVKVQGLIVDKAGVSLANARVSVAGTDKIATSDAEGKFTLDIPDTATFIMIQSYGNETKYVKVSERQNYKIEISPDKNNVALLNDIARYNRVNGMQNLYSAPMSTSNIRQELASRQKQQTMLRHAPSADPLIIVNGVPFSGKFSDINSKHIKEVKILPDANARTLYGERGKNGVIIITLKKGKSVSRQ